MVGESKFILVKVGGSLLRKENWQKTKTILKQLCKLNLGGKMILTVGSIDTPGINNKYLGHIIQSPANNYKILSRSIVAEYLSSAIEEIELVHNILEVNLSIQLGKIPLLTYKAASEIISFENLEYEYTSDTYSYFLAHCLNAESMLVLTDVNGIFNSKESMKIIPDMNSLTLSQLTTSCLDIGMASLIEMYRIPVAVCNGHDYKSIASWLIKDKRGFTGTRVLPSNQNINFWVILVAYLQGDDKYMPKGLMGYRNFAVSRYHKSPSLWNELNSIEVESDENKSAYIIAKALERLGVEFCSTPESMDVILRLCADQVIMDWLYCSNWIESYRNQENENLAPLRRRYAELLFHTSALFLKKKYNNPQSHTMIIDFNTKERLKLLLNYMEKDLSTKIISQILFYV